MPHSCLLVPSLPSLHPCIMRSVRSVRLICVARAGLRTCAARSSSHQLMRQTCLEVSSRISASLMGVLQEGRERGPLSWVARGGHM